MKHNKAPKFTPFAALIPRDAFSTRPLARRYVYLGSSVLNHLSVILLLAFSNIALSNECPNTLLEVNDLLQTEIVETGDKQKLEFSAPNSYEGNILLGIILFLKYEEDSLEEYDVYMHLGLDSKVDYSTARFWVSVDYHSEDIWPNIHNVFMKAIYVPPWEDIGGPSLLNKCISVIGTIYLKHNKIKNENASNTGTDAQKDARPF